MGGAISGQTDTRRVRRTIEVAAPAVATDWTVPVPAGKVWRLVSAYASLVTDANAADRAATLTVTRGTRTFLAVAALAVQAASLTYQYTWSEHGPDHALGAVQDMALPGLILQPGDVVAVSTGNVQAGDQWGAVTLYVVETTVSGGPVELAAVPELIVELVGSIGS